MKLPGFNAESSLAPSAAAYRKRNTLGVLNNQPASGVVRPALRRPQWCQTKYKAYISHHFPVTVCEPLVPDLSGSVATMAATSPVGRQTPITPRTARTLGPTNRFARFQNCRVVALPFIGEVTTTQNCDDSIPDSSSLEVYGHPELTTHWTGGINEMPPPFNRDWFGVAGHSCGCCAGFTDCFDGRCLPRGASCSQHPV